MSKIERGIYQPSVELLKKISDVYNVGMNYFLEEGTSSSLKEINFIGQVDLNSEDLLE